MTKEQQIEEEFAELSKLNKPKALAILNRIAEMDSEEQLAVVRLELRVIKEKQVQDAKFDIGSILSRFDEVNDCYDPTKEVKA